MRSSIERTAKKRGPDFTLNQGTIGEVLRHCSDITNAVNYFMATGNLVSQSGLGLMQATGKLTSGLLHNLLNDIIKVLLRIVISHIKIFLTFCL